ncbi:MAG: hypothetical protein IPK83_18210 [Planctomycetes bacterium]|nr:hypothetical protein [Planctomycetota bacterium]
MEAVGGGAPRPISRPDLERMIHDVPPSVRKKDLIRFEQFAQAN